MCFSLHGRNMLSGIAKNGKTRVLTVGLFHNFIICAYGNVQGKDILLDYVQ